MNYDVECSDDENEMFMYETENEMNNECSVINQPKIFNNEVLALDIYEPGPSSSITYLDTSKNNKYEMTTCPNPSVIQSARYKTLRPKFSRKPIESTLVQNRIPKKQKN